MLNRNVSEESVFCSGDGSVRTLLRSLPSCAGSLSLLEPLVARGFTEASPSSLALFEFDSLFLYRYDKTRLTAGPVVSGGDGRRLQPNLRFGQPCHETCSASAFAFCSSSAGQGFSERFLLATRLRLFSTFFKNETARLIQTDCFIFGGDGESRTEVFKMLFLYIFKFRKRSFYAVFVFPGIFMGIKFHDIISKNISKKSARFLLMSSVLYPDSLVLSERSLRQKSASSKSDIFAPRFSATPKFVVYNLTSVN